MSAGRGFQADPRNVEERLHGPGDRATAFGPLADLGVERRDLGLECVQKAVEMRAQRPGSRRIAAILVGQPVGAAITPCEDKGLQFHARLVASAPSRQIMAARGSVSGQRLGVDGVSLSERSEGADEGFDLARVGAMGGHAGGEQSRQQGQFVSSGRLADAEALGIERVGEIGQRFRFVGQAGEPTGGAVVNDNLLLADVATERLRRVHDFCRVHDFGSHCELSFLELSIVCGLGLQRLAPELIKRRKLRKGDQDDDGRKPYGRAVRQSARRPGWPPRPAPLEFPIEDAIANMRVIDALFRSAKSGSWEKP